MRRLLLLALLALAWPVPAAALQPDERLPDAALEQRARDLGAELRCLVCQNQSIDDSSSPFARDIRLLVRERLQAGEGDEEILAFLTARYGEFILLRPSLRGANLLLWLSPLLALGFAAGLAWWYYRRWRAAVARGAQTGSRSWP